MIETLLAFVKATAGITLLIGFWIAVQSGWRKTFPDPLADEDVLAARKDCHGCAMHAGPCAGRDERTNQKEIS